MLQSVNILWETLIVKEMTSVISYEMAVVDICQTQWYLKEIIALDHVEECSPFCNKESNPYYFLKLTKAGFNMIHT